jgi:hypothetical protein
MRKFGTTLFLLGAAGFFYCQQRMDEFPEVPTGLSIEESLRYPQARWQVGEYAAGFGGAIGLLLMLFPKGR